MNPRVVALRAYAQDHTVEEVAILATKLLGFDAEFGWKTNSNSKHYKISRSGTVVAGPKAMVGRNVNHVHAKGTTKESKGKSYSKARSIRAAFSDVTRDYIKKATPGKGRIDIDPGVNRKKREDDIKIANWLHKTFGGDIRVLKEDQSAQGIQTPDFEWNGKLWELKTPDEFTYNAINKRSQKALRQIKKNPGGIIMNLNGYEGSMEDAEKAIGDRMRNSAKFDVDVIILRKGDQYKVLRYKTSSAGAER